MHNWLKVIITRCATETSHYTSTAKAHLYDHLKPIAAKELPNLSYPSYSWFYRWFNKQFPSYRFKKLRTDVCNRCDELQTRIKSAQSTAEKEEAIRILEIHQADAKLEYKREVGL